MEIIWTQERTGCTRDFHAPATQASQTMTLKTIPLALSYLYKPMIIILEVCKVVYLLTCAAFKLYGLKINKASPVH